MTGPKNLTAIDRTGSPYSIMESELKWRPSAYGIVIENDKILLCPHLSGGYDLPGGGVEINESLKEAVEREVREETGLTVRAKECIAVRENMIIFEPNELHDRQVRHVILFYYQCIKTGGGISTDGFDEWEKKHTGVAEWVALDKLDALKIVSTVDFRDIVKKAVNL